VTFSASSTPETRTFALASAFLLDYMFFEIDQGICHYDPYRKACVIGCCLCFCYGCICPCECIIPLKGGGKPSAPEDAAGSPPASESASS